MGGRSTAEISLPWLPIALVIAAQGLACGGSARSGSADLPAAGSTSDSGGSGGAETDGPGVAGGSGGLPSSGGSSPVGGNTASEGGSAVMAGTGGVAGGAGAGGGGGGAGEGPDKIILFDGSKESFEGWVSVRNRGSNPWKNNGDATMTVVSATGDIQSKQTFSNVFVHLEYLAPQTMTDYGSENFNASGGVFLHGSYGLRLTDSYGLPPSTASCGSVYGLHAPLEVACHELGEWNTFEIEFQAPICGVSPTIIKTPARFLEVKLNGTLIHRNVDVLQQTQAGQPESCERRGLQLQDYGTPLPVSFRNIWAIPRN